MTTSSRTRSNQSTEAASVARLDELCEPLSAQAIQAARWAYAPYSQFQVGAALVTTDHRWFTGANVENASFGATLCAERVAAAAAVAAGSRQWIALAVASRGAVTPCGICRQFLGEFGPQLDILLVDVETVTWRWTRLDQLMPEAFSQRDLPGE